ncbi:MAG: hypothetical protein EBR72_06460 [Bacteroidetes bacterium]|nr:hypothetical protein [Bacteroidota bacterium]
MKTIAYAILPILLVMCSFIGWKIYAHTFKIKVEEQRAMNVANPPVTFLVNQSGQIVYTHTGYVEGDEYDLEDHIKELVSK